VDWRQASPPVLTPIKDQGQCGSCWAFSSTETIESALAIGTGNLTVLSPQNIVSCTPNPDQCGGSGGCDGATEELAFTYVQQHGITTEANWPYYAQTGVCNQFAHTPVATIEGCIKLKENNSTVLQFAVATVGPISVSVDASTWSSYKSGIYTGCDAEKYSDIDHAVLLVGYGTSNGTPYWIIKNQWGTGWGENGYMRLYRHSDDSNWCKMDITPDDGNGCDGGPPEVLVCGDCGIWYDNSYVYGARYL